MKSFDYGYVLGYTINLEEAKEMVGPGWAGLIEEIFNRLPDGARISQIKEKWGGLRFYVDDVDMDILDFIDEIEHKSYTVCEVCGQPGKLRDTGWWRTLCDEHQG